MLANVSIIFCLLIIRQLNQFARIKLISFLFCQFLELPTGCISPSSPTYYSFETSTNLIDDGQNVVARVEESKFDSTKSSRPVVNKRIYVSPSNRRFPDSSSSDNLNNIINRNQISTNDIGSGLFHSFDLPFQTYHKSRGFRRGYLTSARTVESPAYSVDSGGQASSSLTKELAKVFNVKQGFYSGIYDNLNER